MNRKTFADAAVLGAILGAALLLEGPVRADEAEAQSTRDETRRFDVSGFVDVLYAYNANEPADHENFFPGVGTSAKADNEFALNLAQVDLSLGPDPVGFHLALGIGDAAEVVHAGEVDPETWENVIQASIQYQTHVGRGLLIEGGIYPSHIGFESFQTKANWNYTRSWLGELSPYYQTGVKLALPLSPRWSTQVHVLNGWQRIEDNNRGKSLGWQFAYAGDELSFSFNGIIGPELPDDDDDLRNLFDTVAIWKATPALSLGLSIDLAREQQPIGDDASWQGIALYGRFAPPDARTALALRAEYYDDEDGAISGTPQTLREVTATLEHRPVEQLIVKVEGRYDHSSAPVFAGDAVDSSGAAIQDQTDQMLFLVGVVVEF